VRRLRIELVPARRSVPLVIRARFERTFLGLGAFAGLVLFVGGAYLMDEVLRNPLGASDTGILAAGFVLALASFLLIYLVWPHGAMALARRERPSHAGRKPEGPVLTLYGETLQKRLEAGRALGAEQQAAGADVAGLRAGRRSQVLFLQSDPVMPVMSGNNKSERQDADFLLTGHATPEPCFVIK